MRVLLDESVPRRFGFLLVGHSFMTVQQRGWTGTKNGKLLDLAAQEFDVLITADRNIEYQQNLSNLPIAILIIHAVSNRLEALEPLVPDVLRALSALQPKTVQRVPG